VTNALETGDNSWPARLPSAFTLICSLYFVHGHEMNPFHGITLRVLGGFSLEYLTQPCDLAYEKGRALLVYLAMESGRTYSRASLASMFWPELEREAALTNLRQILLNLRQVFKRVGLTELPFHANRDEVWMHVGFGICVDAVNLAACVNACPESPILPHCRLCVDQMDRVTKLYAGEFMQGFSLPECPDFDEWLQVQRESFHLRILAVLTRLSACYEMIGALARALPVALRITELEPWSEEGVRRVMRLYAMTGQGDRALERFRTSCLVLKRELGIVPSEATRVLAARIERGELAAWGENGNDRRIKTNVPVVIAERRQVTVLYCELTAVGIEDIDEALAVLEVSHQRCSDVIRRHLGFLVQTHSGGLQAYFGYPQVSESSARQAVQAALALRGEHVPNVELRVGIHSGTVITSDRHIPDAIGATSGLAIRLRQVVEPGEVAISAATQRLVSGYFECVSLGVSLMRGVQQPIEVFRVDRESGARTRLEAAGTLTPLVGRSEELVNLLSFWRVALQGRRQVVLLRGEAGVGKSRLVLALKDAVREQSCFIRELHCFPERRHSPFSPLIELFESLFGIHAGDTAEEKFKKLVGYVEAQNIGLVQATVPLYARMLGLSLHESYQEPDLRPQQQRESVLDIVLEHLMAQANEKPCLLVIEDVHWVDPSTLELLQRLVTQEQQAPILVIFTARPEFEPPWDERLTHSYSLKALGGDEIAALVASVGPQIAESLVKRIVERADGIPLFAEELARELASGDQNDIPPTLLDLLLSRLDSMGAARIVAQAAATVGREFELALLGQITPFDESMLKQHVAQLFEAELLQGGAKGFYRFKHSLIRDAAYQSQARNEREVIHRRVASAFITLAMGVRPEVLAQHWAEGGEAHKAITGWIEAGKLASQESASHEAVAHFKAGLALLEKLPVDSERNRLELELNIGLGSASAAVHGYAATDGVEYFERAMALCGLRDDDPAIFPAIWRLWASASSRVGYSSANGLAQHLVRMADHGRDPIQRQQGHFALGNTLYWQGEFVVAREHLEHVRAIYRTEHHSGHVASFGEDAGVTSESYYAWVMCFLGYPDQAIHASQTALDLARRLGHPFSLAYALTFAAILHCRVGDAETACTLAQETLDLSCKHGFVLWEIGARLALGWAQAMQGNGDGIESIRECAEATRQAMGGVTLVTLGPLADALVTLGMFATAEQAGEEALSVGKRVGDRHIEAELHRLKGESLLGISEANELAAESYFRMALLISHRQHARLIELRSAASMARLWQKQGRVQEARTLLEDVYRWFSEGFGTADLRAARDLLDTLAT